MFEKKDNRQVTYIFLLAIILCACTVPGTSKNNVSANATGVADLDKIIDIVLRGDSNELKSIIKMTQAKCTFAQGLGGPPKCMENEKEGSFVEVLPVLDSEGYFLRKNEIESWNGMEVSSLFAVYEVSDRAYSDENYPAGDYAIIFINKDQSAGITVQVDQGRIVRIDYGFEYPPSIPDENVIRYLIQPMEIKL